MSKEILRPQKAQPAPVPLAHIVGDIDHMGKVWTPAAQRKPLTVEQIEKCIEEADSKWADAFVSVEWARHLTKAIEAAHGIKETTK
jgi:hypothetical protein